MMVPFLSRNRRSSSGPALSPAPAIPRAISAPVTAPQTEPQRMPELKKAPAFRAVSSSMPQAAWKGIRVAWQQL